MSMPKVPRLRAIADFRKKESGAITVEAVLWLPVFMVFFSLIADVSLMLHGQSKAQRIIQDVNRFASTGRLVTEDEIEQQALAQIRAFSPNATVTSNVGTNDVRTTAVLPASDLDAVGLFARFSAIEITVTYVHLLEV